MAELTIQIPDELAGRLEPLKERLPQLLEQVLEIAESEAFTFQGEETATLAQASTSVYAEVLNFLIKRPTPMEIVGFKVSPPTQERLRTLLEKNREGTLTVQETGELDVYEQLEHLMILLKAYAIKAIPFH
ncbi:MAG: hypothetical protein WBM32_23840 [Crocosphaera sp.]